MAGGAFFDITVTGKGSHGARPEEGVDPVLTACHITTALQAIVSRNISPVDTAVVSVTTIQAVIYVFDESRSGFVLEAGRNMSDELIAAVRAHPIGHAEPLVGQCGARREAVQIEDLTKVVLSYPSFEMHLKAGVRAVGRATAPSGQGGRRPGRAPQACRCLRSGNRQPPPVLRLAVSHCHRERAAVP